MRWMRVSLGTGLAVWLATSPAHYPRPNFCSWLQAAVPPRCPARPLSDEVRPLERRTAAFPRFRQLHPQQQTMAARWPGRQYLIDSVEKV